MDAESKIDVGLPYLDVKLYGAATVHSLLLGMDRTAGRRRAGEYSSHPGTAVMVPLMPVQAATLNL